MVLINVWFLWIIYVCFFFKKASVALFINSACFLHYISKKNRVNFFQERLLYILFLYNIFATTFIQNIWHYLLIRKPLVIIAYCTAKTKSLTFIQSFSRRSVPHWRSGYFMSLSEYWNNFRGTVILQKEICICCFISIYGRN